MVQKMQPLRHLIKIGLISFQPQRGDILQLEAKWENKKVTLTLLAGKNLNNETTYIMTVSIVRDGAGNILENGMVKFITESKPTSPDDPD